MANPNQTFCTSGADDRFGPAVHGCRENFDFTLLFEQSFFSILPCAIFLLIVPLRLRKLSNSGVKVVEGSAWKVKAVSQITG